MKIQIKNNLPFEYPLKERIRTLMMEPFDGYCLVEQMDAGQETGGGIIIAQSMNEGWMKGVVLKTGRITRNALHSRDQDDATIQPGDIVYYAARSVLGQYDPGLDENILILSYQHVTTYIPKGTWQARVLRESHEGQRARD